MAHYTSEHEVAFYAEKCGVTAAHFSSAIRSKRIQSVGNHHGDYYHERESTTENHPVAGKRNSILFGL